jgi:NTE family protein
LLRESCDLIIAVDVSGELKQEGKKPDFMAAILGSFDIVQKSLIAEQVIDNPPDILLRPVIRGVRMLEFNKADQVGSTLELDDLVPRYSMYGML